MNIGRWLQQSLLAMLLFFPSMRVFADMQVNMSPGVTPLSHDIYDLHMTVFWICVGIGTIVFSVLIYSLIMHRKSRGHEASSFHEHPGLEIAWAVIPFIILVAMAVPATFVLMDMENTSDADITVKITGYQWKWKYEYLDEGISFFSNLATPLDQIYNKVQKNPNYLLEVDKPLVLPVNKKVRFLVTSNDVVHSWWVPALGIKRDAIPGFIHESWATVQKTGIYRGQCAELCGANHAFMPIVVDVRSEVDYHAWVREITGKTQAAQTAALPSAPLTKEQLMKTGEEVYLKTCALCHKADGSGVPPTFPAMKGSKMVMGPIADHIAMVVHGKSGTAMQAFGPQLSDEEIAAVVTYERNAWGNNKGDLVQPTDVKKAKSS